MSNTVKAPTARAAKRAANRTAKLAAAVVAASDGAVTSSDLPAPVTPPLPVSSKPTQVAVGLVIEKNRPEQNGIKRPSAGGRCRAVWDAMDEFVALENAQPDAKFVRKLAEENGWNPNNASIEFYQWRKFNGISGRQAKVAAAAE